MKTRTRTDELQRAFERARSEGRPACMPFVLAGHPGKARFPDVLGQVAAVADVVEIGLPFSDPVADGPALARAARAALAEGVSLNWLLEVLHARAHEAGAALVLMSYLNPLLAHGLDTAVRDLAEAGVAGLIVPDVPFEESGELAVCCARQDLALIPLVSPLTSAPRLARIGATERGFLYAVSRTGITGGQTLATDLDDYLTRVRAATKLPIACGFGIRSRAQVERIRLHADGFVVGTALIEAIERGDDPARFLSELRPETRS